MTAPCCSLRCNINNAVVQLEQHLALGRRLGYGLAGCLERRVVRRPHCPLVVVRLFRLYEGIRAQGEKPEKSQKHLLQSPTILCYSVQIVTVQHCCSFLSCVRAVPLLATGCMDSSPSCRILKVQQLAEAEHGSKGKIQWYHFRLRLHLDGSCAWVWTRSRGMGVDKAIAYWVWVWVWRWLMRGYGDSLLARGWR